MTILDAIIPYPDFIMGEMIDPEQFDLNNDYTVSKINEIVALVNRITDSVEAGGSGSDLISITPIAPFASTKLQAFLQEVISNLRSTVDGKSGADFIASTAIPGVTGTTVQAQLKSLKLLLDTERARIDVLTARVSTAETNISNRYTKTEVDSKDDALQSQITTNKTNIANRYTKSEIDTKTTSLQSQINTDKTDITKLKSDMTTHNHDSRYPTRTELAPYLQGGDTIIRIEIFVITNSNNGDGTFSYTNRNGEPRIGQLGASGEQIFALESGKYATGINHISALINDTLKRSVASGGLIESSSTSISLTTPEGTGTEITVEYFERLGVSGEHNIIYGNVFPPPTNSGTMWFKVVG